MSGDDGIDEFDNEFSKTSENGFIHSLHIKISSSSFEPKLSNKNSIQNQLIILPIIC